MMPEAPTVVGSNTGGILQVRTNADITALEKARRDMLAAQQQQQQPEILSLAAHMRQCWEAARRAKVQIEERLLKCMRQRKGEYDPDQLTKIRKRGGSEIYMMLTTMKCRAAEAWIRDIMIPPGEKPWGLDPTPNPDLPGDIEDQIEQIVEQETVELMMQGGSIEAVNLDQIRNRLQELRDMIFKEHLEIAKGAAHRMEREIQDELVEGNFYRGLSQFIEDIVTFPAAFLKGPIIRKRRGMTWGWDENGEPVPQITDIYRKEYERVSPFDLYPSPGARTLQDGYLIEHLRLRRADLQAMIGVPGFNDRAIRGALIQYGIGGLRDWLWTDRQRAEAESRPHAWEDPEATIDCLLFWGNVQGQKLLEWGMSSKEVPEPALDYPVCALLIGDWVPMARINPHPLAQRPYYGASYEEQNDSIWGKAVPELMRDIQRICNATARAIVNNQAIASGPQVEVQKDRIDPGEDIEDIYPWKIWKTKSDQQGRNRQAAYFFQPNLNVDQLLKTYDYFFKQASEVTGIPAYIYGSEDVGGAGKTASGLSMLMNAASKGLKSVVTHIDEGIIVPAIKEHWLTLMLYDQDIEKTGDINVIARASEYLIIAEQLQIRRTEFLNFTNNPIDMSILGRKGRAAVLRETVKSLKMPTEEIIPTKQEMEEQARLEQAQRAAMLEAQQVPAQGEAAVLPGGQQAGQVEG